ncbi:MAG: hypothetical protein ACUVRC_01790 [Desulfotomaculales bacterium]
MRLPDDDAIVPFFQPKIAVDTTKIAGYEVLGRVRTLSGVHSLGPFFHDPAVPKGAKVKADRLIRQKALETDRFLFIDLNADSEGFAKIEERDPG